MIHSIVVRGAHKGGTSQSDSPYPYLIGDASLVIHVSFMSYILPRSRHLVISHNLDIVHLNIIINALGPHFPYAQDTTLYPHTLLSDLSALHVAVPVVGFEIKFRFPCLWCMYRGRGSLYTIPL